MSNIYIRLNSFDEILEFVKVTENLDYDIKLSSGDYVVDGKSILGIFILDLSDKIQVSIKDERRENNFCPKELETFIA